MFIRFIGTGSGKTSLQRFHSSFIISDNKFNLLVDCGDSTSRALLSQNISFSNIDAVLFSHFHADHFTGLPSFLTQLKMNKRVKPLILFAEKSNIKFLRDFIFNSYLFLERMDFELNFIEFEMNKKTKVAENFSFIARNNKHLEEYKKYDTKNKLSFSSASFLFNINEKLISYTGDIAEESDLYIFEKEKPEIIISEFTHISLQEILNCFQKLKPKKLILTHISEENEEIISNINKFLQNNFNNKIIASKDGSIFNF